MLNQPECIISSITVIHAVLPSLWQQQQWCCVSHIQFRQTGVSMVVPLWICCVCHVTCLSCYKAKIAPINVPLGHDALVCSSHRRGLNKLKSPITMPAFRLQKSIKSIKMGSQSWHYRFHHFKMSSVLLRCATTSWKEIMSRHSGGEVNWYGLRLQSEWQ